MMRERLVNFGWMNCTHAHTHTRTHTHQCFRWKHLWSRPGLDSRGVVIRGWSVLVLFDEASLAQGSQGTLSGGGGGGGGGGARRRRS